MNIPFPDVSLGMGRADPFSDQLGIRVVHHHAFQFARVQGLLTGFGKIRISSQSLELGFGLLQFAFRKASFALRNASCGRPHVDPRAALVKTSDASGDQAVGSAKMPAKA